MNKNQIYYSVAGVVVVAIALFFILGGRLTGKNCISLHSSPETCC